MKVIFHLDESVPHMPGDTQHLAKDFILTERDMDIIPRVGEEIFMHKDGCSEALMEVRRVVFEVDRTSDKQKVDIFVNHP